MRLFERVRAASGRIWVRLLLINVTVVLVPVAGLEFARIYERQLLNGLERDMANQSALVRAVLESDLEAGVLLGDERHQRILQHAARNTRTRVRLLDGQGNVVVDSHGFGPPEGPEPAPPKLLPQRAYASSESLDVAERARSSEWPPIAARREVRAALGGKDSAQTRLAHRPKAVFLFSAAPVLTPGARNVAGVVYVTRSTTPVLVELYRIRSGLFKVLAVALSLTVGVTLLLALSISGPLTRLSRAAKRIAKGERQVPVPVEGSGEIRELAHSFRTMTEELDARLAYISDFSADVAHEFKSPLTSIRGAAELLAEGAHEDEGARERFLRNILLDTERLDRLVSRLLELGRIEASVEQMVVLDLRALLERVVRRAEARAPIDFEFRASRTWVRGREADLETAFGNLVDNAQRYAPADSNVRMLVTDSKGGVLVCVEDDGPGIATARHRKIFERFHTSDAERGGTGLGLAIVDSVAKAHGGHVSVESELGRGSRFCFLLPTER